MNKTFRVVMMVWILAGLLAACGSTSSGNTTQAPTSAPAPAAAATEASGATAAPEAAAAANDAPANGERTKVRFWIGLGGQLGEVIQTQVAKFNQSQDKIEVEAIFQQSYNGVQEKFQAALVGGDVPEIVQMEIHATPQFAAAGALTPFEEFYKNDPSFNFDDLLPATLLNQSWQGKLYAMPINRSTPLLYYNKQLFREAGLDPEKPPQTWPEFREMAKKLTKGEGENKVYGFVPASSWWYFESMVWSNGGQLMSDDLKTVTFAEPGAEVVQIWTDMIHTDKTARTYTGDKANELLQQQFIQGRAAMVMNSTADLGRYTRDITDWEFGTAFLPHMDGSETAVPTGGAAAAIPAAVSPEKKQAAWEFIKWWVSSEQGAFWSQNTGYFPVRKSSIELLTQQGYYKDRPNFQTTLDQLQYAREAPLSPHWPAIAKEITKGMEESLINNVPAKDALIKAQARAQEIISQ